MNTSKIIAAAALSMLAAVGAQAETYEGVHQPVSAASRADVSSQARIAARSDNPYAEGYNASFAQAMPNPADRASVRAEAVATAHAANQNLDRKAFVNSVVPEQYKFVSRTTQQAGLKPASPQ
ncbi:MAG: alpha/beta hydrolase [Gammaproteobacteria bacterium]|nr:alpha/beta hydrolase [Gammaproteobacteria bacterium]MBU1440857.1 alpha/beta hydrolase [Gammaproteobacteria bacterium]MBU2284884.1 alpha/beta hydrolase [Gammaproteobacteria bacterium]MBU2410039.1 alpha/beta hydrolase [Gammaproteobacteria bacterium]